MADDKTKQAPAEDQKTLAAVIDEGDKAPLDDAEAEALWNELARADAAKAENADAPAAEPEDKDSGADEAPPAEAGTDKAPTAASDKSAQAAGKDTGKPASTPAPDAWATAAPDLRAAHQATLSELENTKRANADLALNYRRVSGTVSGLQKKIDALQKASSTPPTKDAGAGKPEAGETPSDLSSIFDVDPIKEFEKEYPEIAKPLIGTLRQFSKALVQRAEKAEQQLAEISEDRREQSISVQEQIVAAEHPDWKAVCLSGEFGTWVAGQPQFVQDAILANGDAIVNGHDAARIISMFKGDRARSGGGPGEPPAGDGRAGMEKTSLPVPDKRKSQLESAAYPRGKGNAKVSSGLPPPDADGEEIWNYFAERDRREGAAS